MKPTEIYHLIVSIKLKNLLLITFLNGLILMKVNIFRRLVDNYVEMHMLMHMEIMSLEKSAINSNGSIY